MESFDRVVEELQEWSKNDLLPEEARQTMLGMMECIIELRKRHEATA